MLKRLFIALFSLPALAATLPPVKMTIVDFSTHGRFDFASAVQLRTVEDATFYVDPVGVATRGPTRFETEETLLLGSFHLRDGQLCPAALLADMQAPALKSMLRGGYISRKLYDAVLASTKIWEPEQVRLAFTWSELSLSQARALFPDGIPWDRVMHGDREPVEAAADTTHWSPDQVFEWETKWPNGRPLRIVRAMMMIGVGQVFNPLTGKMEMKPMAWQEGDAHKPIRDLNREIFPFVAEFSRALAEPAPLAGDVMQVYQALVGILQNEARLRGFAEKDVYFFARAFSRDRVRLFESKFGARVFTPELKSWFESSPDTARDLYQDSVPRNRARTSDAVVIATCRAGSAGFRLTEYSQRVWEIRRRSGFRLTPRQARELIEFLYAEVRPAFVPTGSRAALSDYPIMVINASPTTQARLIGRLVELGMDDADAIHSLIEYVDTMGSYLTDPLGVAWLDPLAFTGPREEQSFGFGILNLDERAAAADPTYVPAVLVGISDYYRQLFQGQNPVEQDALRQVVNEIRRLRGDGAALAVYDPEVALATFHYQVGTASAAVAAQLKALGGKPLGGSHEIGSWGLRAGGHIFVFSAADIRRLRAGLPESDGPLLRQSPYQTQTLIQMAGHY